MEKYIVIAKQIIEENYAAVGVRSLCDDEQYNVGDECRESYDWDLENDCSTYHTTGEKANGTCATFIDTQSDDATELAAVIAKVVAENEVYGGQQVIIAGHSVNNDGMFDPNEVRIIDAFVLMVI